MIKVILKAPGKRSEVREIENSHAAIEALLGGKAEQFCAAGYDMFAHETGLIDGMEPNVRFTGHSVPVCSPVVVRVKHSIREIADVLDWASVGPMQKTERRGQS